MATEATHKIVVDTPENPVIAELLANSLMERGVPAFVEGGSLQDPWAVAQRALGNLTNHVVVPGEYAEEARQILEDLRSSSGTLDDETVTQAETTEEHANEQDLEPVL